MYIATAIGAQNRIRNIYMTHIKLENHNKNPYQNNVGFHWNGYVYCMMWVYDDRILAQCTCILEWHFGCFIHAFSFSFSFSFLFLKSLKRNLLHFKCRINFKITQQLFHCYFRY